MNQITRTPEPTNTRTDAPAAPRGEELQQASNRFAELLAKENKETRSKSERDKVKEEDHGEGAAKFEDRADASCGLPYGIHLPGERGQGSKHKSQQEADSDSETMGGDFSNTFLGPPTQVNFGGDKSPYLGPPAPTQVPGDGKYLGPPSMMDLTNSDKSKYLGPPSLITDSSNSESSAVATEADRLENPTPVLTPGDLLLQSFSKPPVEAVDPPAKFGPPIAFDAIRELGERIAERILISQTEAAGGKEMMIQLKDTVLPGTEVRMVHDGERLRVTLLTDNASSFHLLASQQADLQARLGEKVVVNLSFDPEGMISRQRLESPIAAQAGQQAGDDRRREGDEQRRDRRRDEQQDRDA